MDDDDTSEDFLQTEEQLDDDVVVNDDVPPFQGLAPAPEGDAGGWLTGNLEMVLHMLAQRRRELEEEEERKRETDQDDQHDDGTNLATDEAGLRELARNAMLLRDPAKENSLKETLESLKVLPLQKSNVQRLSAVISGLVMAGDEGASSMAALQMVASSVCGAILRRQDFAYKCKNCSADPTCVMCVDCFRRSPCQNHEYKMVRSGGGMCDCGDPTAWKRESFCSKHAARNTNDDEDPFMSIRAEDRHWIGGAVQAGVWLIAMAAQEVAKGMDEAWLSATMASTAKLLTERVCDASDCGKRIVSLFLADLLPREPQKRSSQCMVSLPLTMIGAILDTDIAIGMAKSSETSATWRPVQLLVESCLSNPKFKQVFLREHMYRYEAFSDAMQSVKPPRNGTLSPSAVQVLTVNPVVEEAMDPLVLQQGQHTTVLHRAFSGLLYSLTLHKASRPINIDFKRAKGFVLVVDDSNDKWTHMHYQYHLKYIFTASPRIACFGLNSRLLLRCWLFVLQSCQLSNFVFHGTSGPPQVSFAYELEAKLAHTCWITAEMLTRIGEAMRAGTLDALIPQKWQELLRQSRVIEPLASWPEERSIFEKVVKRCEVAENESASLLELTQSGVTHGDSVLAVFSNVTREILSMLSDVIQVAKDPKAARIKGTRFHEINLQSSEQGFSFNMPLIRFLALVCRAFLDVPRGMTTDEDAIQKLFHIEDSGACDIHDVLDLAINVFVATGQCYDGMWRREGISHLMMIRYRVYPSYFVELDLFLLQLACCALGPDDLLLQLLLRFAYGNPDEDGALPPGIPHLLELILQMVCCDAKSGVFSGHGNADRSLRARVIHRLAISAASHSQLAEAVSKCELDELTREDEFEGQLDAILSEVASSETRSRGTFFRLKNTEELWGSVCPYWCTWTPSCPHIAKQNYRDTNADKFKKDRFAKVCPSAFLPTHIQALHGPLMSLLHNECTQSLAIFVILCAAHHLPDGTQSPKKKSKVPTLQTMSFSKALDLIYLALKDVEVRYKRPVDNSSPADAASQYISWSDYEIAEGRPCMELTKKLLPVKIGCGGHIHESVFVTISRFDLRGAGWNGPTGTFSKPMSCMEALQAISSAARNESNGELVEAAWKIDEIMRIVATALSEEGTSSIPTESAKTPAEDHVERIKNKQATFLKRMREKQRAAAAQLVDQHLNDQKDDEAPAPVQATQNLRSVVAEYASKQSCCYCSMGSEERPLFLLCHSAVGNSLAAIDGEKHPPMEPAPAALSVDAAADEVADDEFDDQHQSNNEDEFAKTRLASSILTCGHMVHEQCMKRRIAFQATAMSRFRDDIEIMLFTGRGYKGFAYLHPGEVLCPLCSRIVSGLCALEAAPSEPPSSEREVPIKAVRDAFAEMCYDCSIGFRHVSDHKAVQELSMDSAMSHSKSLVAAISAFADTARATVEVIRAGGSLTFRQYVGLCAIFNTVTLLPLDGEAPEAIASALSEPQLPSRFALRLACDAYLIHGVSNDTAMQSAKLDDSLIRALQTLHFRTFSRHDEFYAAVAGCVVLVALLKSVVTGLLLPSQAALSEPLTDETCSFPDFDLSEFNVTDPESKFNRLVQYSIHQPAEGAAVGETPFERLMYRVRNEKENPLAFPVVSHGPAAQIYRSSLLAGVLRLRPTYHDFVVHLASHRSKCSRCGRVPRLPMICLHCDAILCYKARPVPELLQHARTCGGGTAVYLAVKENTFIVLQAVNFRAMQITSPYADKFGEGDPGLHRGVPLSLQADAAMSLITQFIQCSWDHSNSAAHSWHNDLNAI